MKKNYFLNLFFVFVIVISSCTPYKDTIYFDGIDRNPNVNHKIENYTPLTVQLGDVLSIKFKSLNPEGSAIFNDESAGSATGSGVGASASTPGGYLVDQKGDITLPLIHNVKVVGMTIAEVQAAVQTAVTPFLKEPIVTVHLSNFRITVMGDVGSPNTYNISSDRISIPQALSMAGDITVTGHHDNILLIREINGERKYINIDVSTSKLIESPYYYLKNNDLLYVQPGRNKFAATSPFKQNLPTVLSLISLLIVAFEISRKYH